MSCISAVSRPPEQVTMPRALSVVWVLLLAALATRGTFFWNDIVNPIVNVTTNPSSNPIMRQKENLGRTRSRGVDLDGVVHTSRDIQLSAGYELAAATVISYPVI